MTYANYTSLADNPPEQEIRDYLRVLHWSDGVEPTGHLAVFASNETGREFAFFPGDEMFDAVPWLLARRDTHNLYASVCLLAVPPTSGRGTADDACVMPGAWLDLDILGPTHAQTSLPTRAEAFAFLAELPLEASVVVDSGGGLQVFWLYRDPPNLEDAETRAKAAEFSRRVQEGLIERGKAHGWTFDKTADLARLLRVPGTLNFKSDPSRPTRIVYVSEARYSPADLVDLCVPMPKTAKATLPSTALRPTTGSADTAKRVQAYFARIGPVQEGNRDNSANAVAWWLASGDRHDMALSDADVLMWLREWNIQYVTPPLPDWQITAKVKNVRRSSRIAS